MILMRAGSRCQDCFMVDTPTPPYGCSPHKTVLWNDKEKRTIMGRKASTLLVQAEFRYVNMLSKVVEVLPEFWSTVNGHGHGSTSFLSNKWMSFSHSVRMIVAIWTIWRPGVVFPICASIVSWQRHDFRSC